MSGLMLHLPWVSLRLVEAPDGKLDARLGIDPAAVLAAPGRQFLRVDHDPTDDEARLLDLTLKGLRLLQPLLEARLKARVESAMSGILPAQQPGEGDTAVEVSSHDTSTKTNTRSRVASSARKSTAQTARAARRVA